jgi:dihydrofolate synthase/folylpolyglutamate synthase
MIMKNYKEAVQRLIGLSNLEASWCESQESLQNSLKRTKQLLAKLEYPERKMKFVHVTGTSGKGSVTNLVHEMLLADGRSVASYSSPHTSTFLERFRVNEKLIEPRLLTQAIELVIAGYEAHLNEGKQTLSYFELATVVALVAFVLADVEWCVLEVGLGGRWDSTNVIPKKEVAVITNIDLDHTDLLGNSVEEIAQEKVGIITGRCAVISGVVQPNLRELIADVATDKKANERFIDAPNNDHRLHNALIATAAAQAVGVKIEVIEEALAKVKGLPCRFEVIGRKPLIIIDGAHNEAKMRGTVQLLAANKLGKVHVIFGCKRGKDAGAMLKALAPLAEVIHTTRYQHGYGAPENPAALAKLIAKSKRGKMWLFADEALQFVLAELKPSDTLLITGSLYLAGELRTHWVSEESIINKQSSQVKN